MKASWDSISVAQSDDIVMLEGNAYFPAESLVKGLFEKSDHTTRCPWKGTAHYYDIVIDGRRNPNAAWYYPDPKPEAASIKDRVAFWNGVIVDSD